MTVLATIWWRVTNEVEFYFSRARKCTGLVSLVHQFFVHWLPCIGYERKKERTVVNVQDRTDERRERKSRHEHFRNSTGAPVNLILSADLQALFKLSLLASFHNINKEVSCVRTKWWQKENEETISTRAQVSVNRDESRTSRLMSFICIGQYFNDAV